MRAVLILIQFFFRRILNDTQDRLAEYSKFQHWDFCEPVLRSCDRELFNRVDAAIFNEWWQVNEEICGVVSDGIYDEFVDWNRMVIE